MGTVNRTIVTDNDKKMAMRLVESRTVPFTLSLTDGKHRSTAQNRLQRLWMNEISQQRGDMTPEEARAYCKLTIGVPLLRSENEAFRQRYDEVLKPLSYEHKLKIMSEPIDLPVTRLMTTKQHTQYLDGIIRHFAEQGIILTMPDDLRQEIQSQSGSSPSEPGNAESDPSSASAASDDSAPNKSSDASPTERETLIKFAKDMLPMAADTSVSPAALKAVEREWASLIKVLSPENVEKARAISESVRAIANGMKRLGPELEHFAEVLECSVEELGGVA